MANGDSERTFRLSRGAPKTVCNGMLLSIAEIARNIQPTSANRHLAVADRGNFFVFELKLDRSPDRLAGELARYMSWVKIHLAADHEVRV